MWAGEQALDVQATHAIAPSARILYYGARSCALSDMLTAFQRVVRDHKATTVSLSFGSPSETQLPAGLHAAWTKATLQASLAGISVFASSGDDGDSSRLTGGRRAVDVPAAYAYVTAVGGTSEGATAAGKVVARTGWEDRLSRRGTKGWTSLGFLWGAGGGASSRVAQPSWQAGKVPAGRRAVPDVAALADPFTGFTTYSAGDLPVVGGTSLAAPVVASVVALSKARTGRKVGLASPSLYRLLGTSALRDVRAGSVGVYFPFNPVGASPQAGSYVVGFDRQAAGRPAVPARLGQRDGRRDPERRERSSTPSADDRLSRGAARQRRHPLSAEAPAQRGGIRSAPSRRMTSPLSIGLSTMCATSEAYSLGRPSREGCGTCASRTLFTSPGRPASMGVSKVPGATVTTRRCLSARSRAAESVRPATPPLDAA